MSLNRIEISGFKSIRKQTIDFNQLNVFIGGNGVGKSNLVGIFHFLNRVSHQELQNYTGEYGGANSILHFGRKTTKEISLNIEFQSGIENANIYSFNLVPTEEDRFIFQQESTYYWKKSSYKTPYSDETWSGHKEAKVAESKRYIADHILRHLNSYRIYHFHDTSASANVKQTSDISDNRFLKADAGNLAAFLYMLKQAHTDHFENIEDNIKQVAPFFKRFILEPSALNKKKLD